MHLSDEQLLEPESEDLFHISECNQCKQRIEALSEIRQQLTDMPSATLPNNSWNKLKSEYQLRANIKKQAQNEKRLKFWRITSFALAASLVLAILAPSTIMRPMIEQPYQDAQLAHLIAENNMLQHKVLEMHSSSPMEPISLNLFYNQISMLDLSIEEAHMQNSSIQEKSELWDKRQTLLKRWLTKNTTSNTLSI